MSDRIYGSVLDVRSACEEEIITGSIPLTPRQAWFVQQRENWDGRLHWNLAWLLEPVDRLVPRHLERAVAHLLRHHDALRLRVHDDGERSCHLLVALDDELPCAHVDLSGLAPAEQQREIERIADGQQTSLNLLHGPVIRVTLFERGPGRTQRLLVIVSHTVADAWSMKILVDDLFTAYEQSSQGRELRLRPKTTSLPDWVRRRREFAASAAFQAELAYWRSLPWSAVRPLPVDLPGGRAVNIRETTRTVEASLDEQETAFLARTLHAVAGTDLEDALLTALAWSIYDWTGNQVIGTFVVNNGRVSTFADEDLSLTVANVASVPQCVFDIRGARNVWDALEQIHHQRSSIPNDGTLWEWLPLEMTLTSEIGFNHLGRQHAGEKAESKPAYRLVDEPIGQRDDPKGENWTLIACTTQIVQNKLEVEWAYSHNLYRHETITQLSASYLRALRNIIRIGRLKGAMR